MIRINWKATTPRQRAARAFALAVEFDRALPRIAAPIPPWAPSLWGLPKLRRVA
jgi:hypothetical protein